MYKFGDRVKCINDGNCYDTYSEWVEMHAPSFYNNYTKGKFYSTEKRVARSALGEIGSVIAVEEHSPTWKNLLVLVVTKSGDAFLIGEEGLVSAA